MQETWVRFLSQEDPLEKEMATHSSILAWEITWTEEAGGPQSMGSQESDLTQRLNHQHNFISITLSLPPAMTEQTCLPICQMTDNFKFLKLSHMVEKLIALQFNIYIALICIISYQTVLQGVCNQIALFNHWSIMKIFLVPQEQIQKFVEKSHLFHGDSF